MSITAVNDLNVAVSKILKEYGDVVYEATEEGLDAAKNVLIKRLREVSPTDTGQFRRSWSSKRYRLRRYVGNTKAVKSARSNNTPLSNILEYSHKSHVRGFMKRTLNQEVDNMAQAIVDAIKNKA